MAIAHLLQPIALPRHRRTGAGFQDAFGVPAADVIAAMDRAGDDVPNQPPAHAVAIDGVGLRRHGLPVRIGDPFGSDADVMAICAVRVTAGVPESHRGIHVSRIGHVLADLASGAYRDLAHYAQTVACAVAAAQYGRAQVTVHARVPYLEELPVARAGRQKLSLEHLQIIARHTIRDGFASSDAGLRVDHLVACPCVQATYRHAKQLRSGRDLTHLADDAPAPLLTHSQRCVTTVVAHGVTVDAPTADMLMRLDDVLFRTGNTLPRDAELQLVHRAHCRPQFIEDALRAAVLAFADAWPPRASAAAAFRELRGHARSLESIHEFDLTAALRVRAADLDRIARADHRKDRQERGEP
jgi:GTP cyclohydrolase FolE2